MTQFSSLPLRMCQVHLAALLTLMIVTQDAAAQMQVTIRGDVVTMRGGVSGNSCEKLWILLQRNRVSTVELSSSGGNSADGRCVGMLIREYKLTTIVLDYCISACSSMWMGGVRRFLAGPNAFLGMHSTFISQSHMVSSAPMLNLKRIWLPLMAPNINRFLMEQWLYLQRPEQVMRFFKDRADLCDGRDCKPIPGQNIDTAGLSAN